MKKLFLITLAMSIVGIAALEARSLPFEKKFEEKEEIRKTLHFKDPSAKKELFVDNVFGSIAVEGYSGQDVQLVAHRTIKASSEEKVKKAKEEVKLDISEEGNTVDIYVDGPFRCREGRRRWSSRSDPGYEVHYDFDLKVPHKTSLFLCTVTSGDIRVKNVEGEFEIKNVNGKIEMTEVAGSGDAHTVNGEVKVLFRQNPESDCSFHTINGDLEITFCPNLSAELFLKTFNGKAYTDFEVTTLPAEKAVGERRDGKFVYKSSRFFGVRVGKGGPEIKFDTMNGDILIANRNKKS